MASFELGIARRESSELVVQTLPDGSTAIFEVATKNVYSLNPSAAAAWEACASATTLSQLAAAMSRRLGRPVTEDLAHEAVSELVAVGLVSVTPGERLGTSRRALLKQAAEVAIPVVLVLTGAEQRAHAQGAGSGPTTTPGNIFSTTGPPVIFTIFKGAGPDAEHRVPLAGAEFDVVADATGETIGHLITDALGKASMKIASGTRFRLIETFAPPSLDAYDPFTQGGPYTAFNNDFGFDVLNTGVIGSTTSAPGTTTPGNIPSTTGPPWIFTIIKGVGPDPDHRVPLEGAEFDVVVDATGEKLGHLITDELGRASMKLRSGIRFRLIETFAPPSLDAYEPFTQGGPYTAFNNDFGLDLINILKTT